jgi:hypothetical protein
MFHQTTSPFKADIMQEGKGVKVRMSVKQDKLKVKVKV